nr:hypothetical protein [Tanacetum cinerariifolium]
MHQPWRIFVEIINMCISEKSSGLDRLRLSGAQILWGMYNKKNIDFVALLWEDFMFQADNREISSVRKENMPYPIFTKVIINHFISKDKTISMRNQINIHTIRNDTLLGVVIRNTPGVSVSKNKSPIKVDRGKGMDLLSEAALLEAAQLKKTLKKSKLETHKLHASGSGDGVGSQPNKDDDSNDDDSDDVSNDDDDVDSDADGDNKASDSEKTNFDEDENPNLNQNENEEEEYEDEYVRTPDTDGFIDDEEYEELYKDVNVSTRLEESSQKDFRSYTVEFEKKAKDERKRYIDLIEISVKEIIKDEVKSQLSQILPKEVSEFDTPMIQSTITESLENVVLAKSSSQPKSTYKAAASLTEFELKKILLDKMQKSKSYRGKAYSLKRDREDKDKDEDPPAGSDHGLKKRKTSKDAKPSKGFKSKESKSSSSKGTKSQSKSSSKSTQAKESVFETADIEMLQNQGAVTDRLDWNNPEGQEYPFDLRNPLPLIEDRGIQDMVPLLYSPVKVAYDKYAVWGITRWGSKRQRFMDTSNRVSKHDMFSTKRIIAVTHVKVIKWYDYGYLEEIVVPREDQKLYKFMEGDFPRLNLHDIVDMLLLLVQKKLSNLETDVIFDLNVVL